MEERHDGTYRGQSFAYILPHPPTQGSGGMGRAEASFQKRVVTGTHPSFFGTDGHDGRNLCLLAQTVLVIGKRFQPHRCFIVVWLARQVPVSSTPGYTSLYSNGDASRFNNHPRGWRVPPRLGPAPHPAAHATAAATAWPLLLTPSPTPLPPRVALLPIPPPQPSTAETQCPASCMHPHTTWTSWSSATSRSPAA